MSVSPWRRDFASGLVVLAPLIVALYILAFFCNGIASIPYAATALFTDGTVAPPSEALEFIISIIIFPLLVLSAGYLMRTTAGRLLGFGLDAAMNRAPSIRIVYNASELVVETAFIGTEDFQKPVHLETWPGIRMTVLETGKTTKDSKAIVLMSTAPNITTEFVVEVDPENIEETDEKVEGALTCVPPAGFAEQDHVDEFNIEVIEKPDDGRVPSNE